MRVSLSSREDIRNLVRRWGLWLFLVWLVAFVFSHSLLHFPLPARVVIDAGRSIIIDILAVSTLVTLAGAIGSLLLRSLDEFDLLEQVAFRALLGLGVISLIVLVVGMAGLLPPTWLGWTASVLLLAVLYRPALAWLRSLRHMGMQLLEAGAGGGLFTRWMQISVLALLGIAALQTLAPPIQWDSLTYHLTGPRIFIDHGQIIAFPELHYLGFPMLTEMLYTWLMILARPQTGPMLHWYFGTLGIIMLLGLARRMQRPAAGWLAAAILLADRILWEEFHWAYSDLSAMAYILAALIVLLAWHRAPDKRPIGTLIRAGVFVGLALGTKYTVAGPVLGIGMLVLWLSRRDGLAGILRSDGVVSMTALVVFLPWLIRNTVLYGNPTAPFFWGTADFDAQDQYSYLHPGTGFSDPLSLLMVPLQGTIFGLIKPGPGDVGGPLLVSLLPLAIIGWRNRAPQEGQLFASVLIFTLPAYLLWIYGIAMAFPLSDTRLLFPLCPAIALIGATGLESLSEKPPAPDIVKAIRLVVSAAVTVAVYMSWLSFVGTDTLKVSFGLVSESDYLTQALPGYYEAMQYINRELPEDARILFLWEPRIFHCRRNCIPDSLLNQWWHDRQLEPHPRKIAQRWRERGITHVLIWDAGMLSLGSPEMRYELLEPADIAALEIVRSEDLELVWDLKLPTAGANDLTIYSLYELEGAQP